MFKSSLLFALASLSFTAGAQTTNSVNPPFLGATVLNLLPPHDGNPRNSEGSFVALKDGRILFAYSRFTGGGDDNDSASIVGRYSSDGGRAWSTGDRPIVGNEGGMNVMSASLLRLADGRIALFYLRKNSTDDCHPYLRYSTDEARTWSDPILCIRDRGYYVLNNDRVIQLHSGRLVLPVALHPARDGKLGSRGKAMVYLSGDAGRTWRRSKTVLECPVDDRAGFQEPGVVELKDHRLMMFTRTALGSQYISYSSDSGETWSDAHPSAIRSPLAPASIKRIPSTGDLLLVWNDTSARTRTPLTLAISTDDGKTWIHPRNLLASPAGWYCYTAIYFTRGRALLAFVAGGDGLPGLSKMDLAYFPVKALYRK
ncbi:MAG: sialidase family protein [Bryobacteraceae bacterium]